MDMRVPRVFGVIALLAFALAPGVARADDKPLLAVFDIDAYGTANPRMVEKLTAHLAKAFASRYRLVPRQKVKAALAAQKARNQPCDYGSCAIALGIGLAAEKSVGAQILNAGDHCMVTVTLYDLQAKAAEHGAMRPGSCNEKALAATIDDAVSRLYMPPEAKAYHH